MTLLLVLQGPAVWAGEIKTCGMASGTVASLRANPGDVLVIPDGVYEDVQVDLQGRGTREQPVTLRPQTAGKVVFTGRSRVSLSGEYLMVTGFVFDQAWNDTGGGKKTEINQVAFVGAAHCRLTECAFIECGNPASTKSHIVNLRGRSSLNRVDHCFFCGSLSMSIGVRLDESERGNRENRFDHNWFKDIVRRSSNGQEAVQLGQGSHADTELKSVVEHCLFERVNGDAEIISSKSSGNVIRRNTFRNCDQAEVVLRGGNRAMVEGNFFFGGKGGVRVHGEHHIIRNNCFQELERALVFSVSDPGHARPAHCLVVHNTIADCRGAGILLGNPLAERNIKPRASPFAVDLPPLSNVFLNNLMTGDVGTLVRHYKSEATVWRGNIAWARPPAEVGFASEGILCADPGLVRTGELYRLPQTGSPAVDAGCVTEHLPADDMDGQRRDAKPDVGCDETSSEPPRWRPLQPADVGPSWMRGDPDTLTLVARRKPMPELREK